MKRKARSITPGNDMEGKKYDPYVKGHHFGSKGVVGRIYNRQIERTQHTISNLELKYLTLLKWSKVPTDIREQFVLPLGETLAIAEELGIPHPQDRSTREWHPMSTDFLVSLRGGKSIAMSVKYAKAVSDRRVLEKLQIEQEYWRRQDTEWKLATESDIPQALLDNIEWVQEAGENPHPDNASKAAEELLAMHLAQGLPPREAGRKTDKALRLETGTGLFLIRHFLAARKWSTDMRMKIDPAKPITITRYGMDDKFIDRVA
jgi:TnsA endonuclease N terminal/TnsA endonuclease C terminal